MISARAKLVCGVIFAPSAALVDVAAALTTAFGPVDLESDEFAFVFTKFYEAEMGEGLRKKFFSFERLVAPDSIVEIKLRTNTLEDKFVRTMEGGRTGRSVNLDPGYVTLPKFVLATTKDSGHRVYLSRGIYGEATLRFVRGSFVPFEWTYPDYRSAEYVEFLNRVREVYQRQIKNGTAD